MGQPSIANYCDAAWDTSSLLLPFACCGAGAIFVLVLALDIFVLQHGVYGLLQRL